MPVKSTFFALGGSNEELEESQEKKITTSNRLHSWVGRHTRKDYY